MKRLARTAFAEWWRSGSTVLFSLGLSVVAVTSRADESLGSGAWLFGLELQQRNFETMSVGDTRPTLHAAVGARGSIEWLVTPSWMLGLSGDFGGSWFDWSDPQFSTAGKIEDVAWGVRCGVDRVLRLGARGTAAVGVGVEYGEAHSWVYTLGNAPNGGHDIADEGPRCYWTGGFARLAVISPVWRRFALCAQLSESIYGAHASDPQFGTQFNWLGKALSVSVGLRFQIVQGSTR